VANTAGKMESPLYPIIDKKWANVKKEVRGWYVNKTGAYKLGAVHSVAIQSDVWAISCLVQDENLNTDLTAFKTALKEVAKMAKYERAGVHISSALTDEVPELKELVEEMLLGQGVNVVYYEEENSKKVEPKLVAISATPMPEEEEEEQVVSKRTLPVRKTAKTAVVRKNPTVKKVSAVKAAVEEDDQAEEDLEE
jgi:hypothetical protein